MLSTKKVVVRFGLWIIVCRSLTYILFESLKGCKISDYCFHLYSFIQRVSKMIFVTALCIPSLFCRGTIWNLYSVPRIAEPVWLTMMSSTLEKTQLCQRFLKEFTLLIEQINKNQ